METGLGLCPASWALPYLLQFDRGPVPCPMMGHSIGPWQLPVPLAAARVQSTHLKPQAAPRAPWEIKETLGPGVTTDGREVSKEQAQGMHGAVPAGERPIAPGLPWRDTDWHEWMHCPAGPA